MNLIRQVELASANPKLLVGGLGFAAIAAIALAAPLLPLQDPLDQSLFAQNLPPFWLPGHDSSYLLGTDSLGRDLLSRLVWGARPVLIVMVLGAALSGIAGVIVGLVAGYLGGGTDAVLSRVIEIFMAFPPMLLAIVLVAVVGPGLYAVVFAIALIGWTRFARVVRAEVLVLREQDFITAAHLLGYRWFRILFQELLPNIVPMVLALLALEMGRAIVVEAILAFIGFSTSDMATWGGILADGRNYVYQAWWIMTLPIVAITLSVLTLSLLADGLRLALDPVIRR
ncbi:ABC transporter permease [Bradyrhizobium sp. NP1]|uniref:ABC transporter permease n=1 Tax=Bradyrhizobium sp. NP1 TaxID=3049772 RepID=UPI0025A61671|nr:ABC transporter permease [Bradyrhizobium sp. NP1]WJR75820.1 ABC transporter permease [Bradyrhizobium sp. NP1]